VEGFVSAPVDSNQYRRKRGNSFEGSLRRTRP
jgi:hypothetical protein